jgi:NADH-quinone oxidoreductase subunit H
MNPVNAVVNWLRNLLTGWRAPILLTDIVIAVIGVLVICVFVLVIDILLVWVERKLVARFQDRLGPNRLGPWGLIQPIADVIKLLIKEDITPKGADRVVYNFAPILSLAAVLLLWAVIPFAPTVVGAEINVAILYVVAVGTLGTLSILMAGWASNNKYALLGAFRTVAQMISYEVPMVITLLIPVILSSSMGLNQIVQDQSVYYIAIVPLAAILFLISSVAEIGRAPFDLVEAESEIVAGFHIEYTGMKFGLFYAGELLHALTVGAIFATLFLGGWRGPGINIPVIGPILGVFYLFAKAFLIYWVTAWLKYSLPRIRIDHMLAFNWKFLTPVALALLIVVAILDKVLKLFEVSNLAYIFVMLTANIIVGIGAIGLVRHYGGQERVKFGETKEENKGDEIIDVSSEQSVVSSSH